MEVAGKLKNVPIIIATARDGWFSGKKYHLIDPETKIPFPLPARQQGYDSMEVNDEGQLVGHYTETHEDEQGHTYSVKKVAILDVRTGDDLNRNPDDLNARKAGSGRMHDNLRDARGTDLRQRR
jgi:hypothetical protein